MDVVMDADMVDVDMDIDQHASSHSQEPSLLTLERTTATTDSSDPSEETTSLTADHSNTLKSRRLHAREVLLALLLALWVLLAHMELIALMALIANQAFAAKEIADMDPARSASMTVSHRRRSSLPRLSQESSRCGITQPSLPT